jgi:outer membrane lipoprotein-sorting protein
MIKDLYKIYIILLSAICLFVFNSCTSSGGSETEEKQLNAVLLTPGELKQKINEQSNKLTSIDCEGDITIDSPELNSSGSLTLSAFKPDSIYCRLDGPFGISVARFLITRNNFIYHNVRENVVIKGSSNSLNLGAILRLKVNFDDLLSGYTNSYFFKDTSSSNSEVTKEKDFYILKITDSVQTIKYWVNSKYYYIEKHEIYDNTGRAKLQILYSDFEFDKNIYFPANVYITNPVEKQNLWISYGKRAFNNNRLKFKMTIPKSAKIIEWE